MQTSWPNNIQKECDERKEHRCTVLGILGSILAGNAVFGVFFLRECVFLTHLDQNHSPFVALSSVFRKFAKELLLMAFRGSCKERVFGCFLEPRRAVVKRNLSIEILFCTGDPSPEYKCCSLLFESEMVPTLGLSWMSSERLKRRRVGVATRPASPKRPCVTSQAACVETLRLVQEMGFKPECV